MMRLAKAGVWALVLLAMLPFAARAQQLVPVAPPPGAAAPQSYAPQQLDQLTAPIALYPDPLVAQILMAATYPLEVVEAGRWLQDPQNAGLQGDQLAAALAQQPWDPSVKSLVAFPQVLSMMDSNLQWTEQLGDAFLAQQADVMNSVQRLRQMAESSGHLASTPQQTVESQDGAIVIAPANPDVVYVPYYNPQIVYGTWPYPGYDPYYFPFPGIYYGSVIGFGVGIAVVDWLWGWDHWDWRNHRIDIDANRYSEMNRGHAPPGGGVWEHNVAHRHGVPYASPAARAQYQGAADQARRNYRGYTATQATDRGSAATVQRASVSSANANVRQSSRAVEQPQAQRAAAPVFESFSRGSDVRAQSQRGAYSRSTMSAAPVRSAPARSAPSGGARGGGHGGNVRTR